MYIVCKYPYYPCLNTVCPLVQVNKLAGEVGMKYNYYIIR